MKHIACSIYDVAVQAFNRPFFVPSIGLAMRSFEDEVNRKVPDNPMSRHSKDFALFQVGTFDDVSGQFNSLDIPVRLCEASSVISPEGNSYAPAPS